MEQARGMGHSGEIDGRAVHVNGEIVCFTPCHRRVVRIRDELVLEHMCSIVECSCCHAHWFVRVLADSWPDVRAVWSVVGLGNCQPSGDPRDA